MKTLKPVKNILKHPIQDAQDQNIRPVSNIARKHYLFLHQYDLKHYLFL